MTPTVNILGLPYTVKRVPYIVRDGYLVGQLNMETQEIKILDTLTPELSELTLSSFHLNKGLKSKSLKSKDIINPLKKSSLWRLVMSERNDRHSFVRKFSN